MLRMRKYYYVTTFILLMIVSFISITYSFEYGDNNSLKFELVGPETLYMDVNTDYVEYGITVKYNGKDISNDILIDSGNVNTKELGEYLVKYSINIDGNYEYIYRKVKVIDKLSPEINLIDGENIKVILGGNYYEYGYEATDNYDGDLTNKVIITGEVDTSKEGSYTKTYEVTDSSGNKTSKKRTIEVVKPSITLGDRTSGIINVNSYNVRDYSNTVTKNSFNDKGIYLEGYVRDNLATYKIKLKNRDSSLKYLFNMTVDRENYYSGNLDLTMVANGIYDVYVVGNVDERLLNKLNVFNRIVRARVANKLVTFMYDDDNVSIKIEDFKYEYDFVIDPGHGGSDIGTSNGLMAEKDLNLLISKYEKCRYESMGYKVYMVRYDDTYGEMLGDKSIDQLDRRGLTLGYYGSVSRIIYSNHHNGSINSGDYGFEMLVGNQRTLNDLVIERSLYNKFKSYYGINDNAIRVYSRDYDTGGIYNKLYGEIYSNTNYYAVIRIPYELFNVDNTIYEAIYMTNNNDFNFYVTHKKWVEIAEIKIKEYVNYLGGVYNPDNKKCL